MEKSEIMEKIPTFKFRKSIKNRRDIQFSKSDKKSEIFEIFQKLTENPDFENFTFFRFSDFFRFFEKIKKINHHLRFFSLFSANFSWISKILDVLKS